MLDKGKGLVLEKLRVIKIEQDSYIYKFNYGSQKGYSIEEIILEKRLLYDLSMWHRSQNVHAITDLESCYDR